MTPQEVLASYRRSMDEVGEDILIRRFTGSGTPRPKTDTAVRARVMGYQPNELVGSIVQGDRKVIALVDSLSDVLPVLTTDKIVVRGRELAIIGVDDSTRRIGGTLVALEIQIRG